MFVEFVTDHFAATVLVFVIVFMLTWLYCRRPAGIPPGPPVYIPFLGNFPQMMLRDPSVQMQVWRKQYGDVFSVYFGRHLVIIVSGYDTMKEAFVKQGDAFSDRTPVFMADMVTHGLGILSSSGQLWKEQRTFALEALRGFGFGKRTFQDKIQEEISVFLQKLQEENGQAHDIRSMIQTSISNVICSIVLGHRFDHEDDRFRTFLDMIDHNVEAIGRSQAVIFFPILWYLPGDFFKIHQILKNAQKVENFFLEVIEEHKRSFDENDIRDFIGAYLKKIKECERAGENTSFHEECMLKVVGDFFIAGSETTSTTVRWFLAYILNYPEVQETIQTEIDNYVGRSRLPSLEDRPNLPFLEATILEVMRLAVIAPLAIPHATSKEVHFKGYRLPRGVPVLPLLTSVLHDPAIFKNPDEFRPQRFLDKDGKVQKPEEHIPFSMGRRVCLGESLARMELFLFISAMFQRFTFSLPEGAQPPSLEGYLNLTYVPRPFKLRAILRTY